jgi:hypothetical protein
MLRLCSSVWPQSTHRVDVNGEHSSGRITCRSEICSDSYGPRAAEVGLWELRPISTHKRAFILGSAPRTLLFSTPFGCVICVRSLRCIALDYGRDAELWGVIRSWDFRSVRVPTIHSKPPVNSTPLITGDQRKLMAWAQLLLIPGPSKPCARLRRAQQPHDVPLLSRKSPRPTSTKPQPTMSPR